MMTKIIINNNVTKGTKGTLEKQQLRSKSRNGNCSYRDNIELPVSSHILTETCSYRRASELPVKSSGKDFQMIRNLKDGLILATYFSP